MTKDQRNRALIVKAQAGDRAAMETLLQENTALIQSVARRYKTHLKFCEWDDLMQTGRLGFVRAMEKFDLSRSVHFSTYAHQWIRQMMGRLIEGDRLIHIPAHMQTPEHKGKDWVRCHLSLDKPRGEGDDGFHSDRLVAPGNTEREVIGLTTREAAAAFEALEKCPMEPADREALMLMLGLKDGQDRILKETAELQGVSREAVRMRCKRALHKLRRYIEREGLMR